jgi:hypothetical protein
MSVNCYNGRFVITAKSLEMNVSVVTRVDCIYVNLLLFLIKMFKDKSCVRIF